VTGVGPRIALLDTFGCSEQALLRQAIAVKTLIVWQRLPVWARKVGPGPYLSLELRGG